MSGVRIETSDLVRSRVTLFPVNNGNSLYNLRTVFLICVEYLSTTPLPRGRFFRDLLLVLVYFPCSHLRVFNLSQGFRVGNGDVDWSRVKGVRGDGG